MRRVSFFTPAEGLTVEAIVKALGLVGIRRSADQLADLTELELLQVYDYAHRVHLAASDSRVQWRPRPSVLLPDPHLIAANGEETGS